MHTCNPGAQKQRQKAPGCTDNLDYIERQTPYLKDSHTCYYYSQHFQERRKISITVGSSSEIFVHQPCSWLTVAQRSAGHSTDKKSFCMISTPVTRPHITVILELGASYAKSTSKKRRNPLMREDKNAEALDRQSDNHQNGRSLRMSPPTPAQLWTPPLFLW